jgi:DnaJ-class molecular chaperone
MVEAMTRHKTVPQKWFVCDACDGSGVEVFGTWEYEPGCRFGHDSTDERPCPQCNGDGGWLADADDVDEVQP